MNGRTVCTHVSTSTHAGSGPAPKHNSCCQEAHLIDPLHPGRARRRARLRAAVRHRPRDLLNRDAHEVAPCRAANEQRVLVHRHEHHVHVERRQAHGRRRVQLRDGGGEGGFLRAGEGGRVVEDAPEGHGGGLGGLDGLLSEGRMGWQGGGGGGGLEALGKDEVELIVD